MTIDIPKKSNQGEDAPPLFLEDKNNDITIVGVFDGMGGSGSAMYEDKESKETHTGAYLASRSVRESVYQYFNAKISKVDFVFSQDDIEPLKQCIMAGLEETLKLQNYAESKLKSSLIRTLPTTMAVGIVRNEEGKTSIQVIWAGDSRIYLLSSEKGLEQLTKDDLKKDNDPFQNIKNDSQLANAICLEGFDINYREYQEDGVPPLVFAATDGCFQYVPTPFHFEEQILKTMMKSKDVNIWQSNLTEELSQISGDDLSLALTNPQDNELSESTFRLLKDNFERRWTIFKNSYQKPLKKKKQEYEEAKNNIRRAEQHLTKREDDYKDVLERIWKKYKETYYFHFNNKAI
jgi:hypothetical protein